MNMAAGNGQLTVPPGFRFHPTDEELLHYYLRKKVSCEAIDLDVIREVDLNKLEPWDLKEKCRIGSGPQNEWYFFSHKDKKYPTGTRTNRATAAGFWKATGRDKAIHLSDSRRIGMRKTLVFYTGRAPHGQKTDWITHEYRLDDHDNADQIQEDGWVVCRVFKKKNHNRGFQPEISNNQLADEEASGYSHMKASGSSAPVVLDRHNHQSKHLNHHHHLQQLRDYSFDGSMHLPQLFSQENTTVPPVPSFVSPVSLNTRDMIECSQNLLRLTSKGLVPTAPDQRCFNGGGDWTFLDKILANSHHHHNNQQHLAHQAKCPHSTSSDHHHVADHHAHDHVGAASTQRSFPFQYLGCDTEILNFPK